HEALRWRNAASTPATELRFHLYWNAFKNETTAMLARSRFRRAPVADGKWGWVDVDELRCDGQTLALELREDGTVARAALPRPVAPGQTVRCELRWRGQMPALTARAGYAGEFHMVAQWFPKIGVWDGRTWKCHVYCETCEFFADFGVHDVAITVPRRFVVGASGVVDGQELRGDERTEHYHAEDVHDFAWAAAPGLAEKRASMDATAGLPPVAVRLLYPPDHAWFADRHLAALAATLRDYGDWFGRYPYSTLT